MMFENVLLVPKLIGKCYHLQHYNTSFYITFIPAEDNWINKANTVCGVYSFSCSHFLLQFQFIQLIVHNYTMEYRFD